VRRFLAPAVRFAGGAATELLIAVHMLRELNDTGARKGTDRVRADQMARLCGFRPQDRQRHRIPALLGAVCVARLRDGLRSGDVYVTGRAATRTRPPTCSLPSWEPQCAEFCRLVGKSADPAHALATVTDELHEAVGELEKVLAEGDGPSVWTVIW
jgi:hypothetical protein